MKKLLSYSLASIFLISLTSITQANDYLINQEVDFDDFETTQNGGQGNTQALNNVSTNGDSIGIRQDVDGDNVNFEQNNGSDNLQALNAVEVQEDGRVGITWQKADIDQVTFEQNNGNGNTQAINHVEIK